MGQTTVLRRFVLGRPALAAAVVAVVFLLAGGLGVYRYVQGFWLYRGFDPPQDPAFVTQTGSTQRLYVASAALGGRSQPVDVYLPPGYATHPSRRYPVFYLLHGVPGRPGAFLETVRAGVVEDILVARGQAKPMILVMPFGSTGSFTDKEWANGIGAHDRWETFLARDVVRAIDRRYRTIATGSGRALGGLSEGGYGAINIGLHHPHEFRVIESWSGYQLADDLKSIFGHRKTLLAANSPMLELHRLAPVLRQAHTYIWFYSGSDDRLRKQNERFSVALRKAGIPHRFFIVRGGHNWALWRDQAANALLAASERVAH